MHADYSRCVSIGITLIMQTSVVQALHVDMSKLELITSQGREETSSNQDTGVVVRAAHTGLNTAQALQAQYSNDALQSSKFWFFIILRIYRML